MRRWLVVAALVPLTLIPLLLAATRPADDPAEATPPIRVGKTYGFGVGGADLTGKVLAAPRGGWLRVEVPYEGKPRAVWLNLRQVSYVLPDPPPDGCPGGGCRAPANAM